jgi:Thioredoxin-like domain
MTDCRLSELSVGRHTVRRVGQGRIDRGLTMCDLIHQGDGGPATKSACPTLNSAVQAIAKLLLAMLLLQTPRVWAQNFSIADPELRTAAEAARERSARYWSGRSLPGVWSNPCPVDWSTRTGPGSGLTCFRILNGEVFGWQMTLRGDRDTVLRDVIPHEVDHAVRVSLCRRPLPRWLDEGCATLFESETSHEQLRRLRQSSRLTLLTPTTIDQMSYPATANDTARLYAEGFSLVEYLLSRGTSRDLLNVQFATEPPSRSLVQVYRTELPQLLTGWQAWEQQRLAAGTRCDCVHCPWHRRATSQSTVSTRPTLTIWSASWCIPCQQFHRDLANQPGFRARLESKFQLVIRHLDQSSSLAVQAGIRSVPVFVAPDRRVEGYLGPEWLLRQLGCEESVRPAVTSVVTPPKALPVTPREPVAPQLVAPPLLPPSVSLPAPPPQPALIAPGPPATIPGRSSLWTRFLGLAPVVIPVLTSLGVMGGTAVTGGVGGVALMLLLKILQRRATGTTQGKSPAEEGGVAAPTARAPFPRQLDEAGELLGLRQSEGRVATLDALRGMFLDDELDKLTATSDPAMSALIQRIRTAVDTRVDEVAPLTTQG